MNTESEAREIVYAHIETWFKKFPQESIVAMIFPWPNGGKFFRLVILSYEPFSEADEKVFKDMDGFKKYITNPAEIYYQFGQCAVIFEFPFGEKQ